METFEYPAPLKKDDVDPAGNPVVDEEEIGEGHWIKVRIPRSRGDVDEVADITQSIVSMGGEEGSISTRQRIKVGNRAVFELLCEGWSFTDRDPNGADYDRLDGWSGIWVTACLAEAMRRGTSPRWAEGNEKPSGKPSGGRRTSASARSRA